MFYNIFTNINSDTHAVQVKGKWHGETLYTYTEGPRAGRSDLEQWVEGEMVASRKHYGPGVEGWEDLGKLDTLTQPHT